MALYPNDATSGSFSMLDRKPDNGYSTDRVFSTMLFETESGYEKRRLRSRRSKRTYDLSYTKVSGIVKAAIEGFYLARSGDYSAFTLDLAHLNDSGYVTVRFDGPLRIQHVASISTDTQDNFYSVSFTLKETYD